MQFKKLAAITGSALMAGLSLAAPVLATSVTALKDINKLVGVTDSSVNFPMFVIGATAATSDVAGAVDMAVLLASNAKKSSVVTVTGATETVTGGTKIRTTGNELIPWTNIRSIKSVLTGSDADFLKGGTYYLTSGTSGAYREYLYLGSTAAGTTGNQAVKFDTPSGETAPSLYLDVPNSQIFYEYLMAFPTSITFGSTATDNTGLIGSTIKFMGKDFAISDATVAGSVITSMTMLGGGTPISVETGGSKTVSVGGKDYVITLTSVAAENIGGQTYYSAIGDVNGEAFQLRSGQTRTLSDGTTIGSTKVFAPIVAGQSGYATLTLGGAKYVLPSSGSVTKDGVAITGLTSTIVSASLRLSSIALDYTPNTAKAYKAGDKFTDVFAAAFDIKFNSLTTAFDDTVFRQTIQYSSSGPNVRLTYTNADGENEAIDIFYNSAGTMTQGRTSTIDVVTDEYNVIDADDGDYFLLSSGGFSHLLQFTSMDTTNAQMTFTDVGTGQSSTISYSAIVRPNATLIMDGFSYGVHISSASGKTIQVDLNRDSDVAGIAYASLTAETQNGALGQDFSVFMPKLITAGQGGLYIYNPASPLNVSTGTAGAPIALPNGLGVIKAYPSALTAGITITFNYTDSTGTLTTGTLSLADNTTSPGTNSSTFTTSTYGDFRVQCYDSNLLTTANLPYCRALLFDGTSYQTNLGFVLVEEAQQGSTTHNWIFFPVTYSSTLVKAGISTPTTDDANLYTNWDVVSGSTTYKGMSTYGTYTEYDTTSTSATIKYPDSFTYANVYVLGPTGTISVGGTAGSVTTETVLPINWDIVKLDSEMSASDKTNNDLVLIGGPCINTLVAELATNNKFPYTCANWPGREDRKSVV
jgi:hypothetical protein